MLSLPSSSSSTSSSYVSPKKYDVFLSFRGEDTRTNFTDHLYAALKRSGIITFRDDQRLEAGKDIAPELFKAIRESWCSIIVFSETYAFSGWCLDELAEIVKHNEEGGHKIFPIFYDVDPSDLRRQTGRVAEAFAKHEERYKENKYKTQSWRSALTQVANLKGWHLKDRPEAEFIGEVVKNISAILLPLRQAYSSVPNELIGIHSRLEELHSKISIGEDDIRIIGICGMGGIGKTTLARVAYDHISPHFEAKSFLSDVREVSAKSGLAFVQKQLLSQIFPEERLNFFNVQDGSFMISRMLSRKKVLIVIDDADNIQHLKWLVGRRDWFGSGSRIIVTTRDEQVLLSHRVDDVYKPAQLDKDKALRLFSLKAFNSYTPENGFMELSMSVVKYADGLPLALEVLGSFFCGRDPAQWKSAIARLKRDSNKEIHERLRISFDGLEETDKKIFLDIACFFKWEEKDLVVKVLDGCGFFPEIGIDVLVKKSLIKVYNKTYMSMHGLLRGDEMGREVFEQESLYDCKYLGLHDLLQEMGRKIVKEKFVDEPGKRCRLWEESDVFCVLTKNIATESIEGMHIDIDSNWWERRKMSTWNADAFLKMKKLRLLRVFNIPNYHDLKYLCDELRLLHWIHYPLRSLPSSFQPEKLVALLLPYSSIEQLWKGKLHLERLKLVNLNGSRNLVKTPDFTLAPNLERLIFEGCIKMIDVHPSVGLLRRLKILNLRDCKSLRSLPTKIGMQSLQKLILSGCSNLGRLPDQIDGEMGFLVELYLDGTGIRDLPSLIGHLSGLVLLNLKDCRNLISLPSSISGLQCLKTLNLSGCSKVENLPESLQQVESLEELDLSGTAITKPASFIFEFKNLKCLSFRGCKGPPSKLRPNLPSLFKVMLGGSMNPMALTLPPLLGLTSLTELDVSYCNLYEGDIPSDICCLSSLKRLSLHGNKIISLPANLDRLSSLTYLGLADCMEVKSLPELLTCTEIWTSSDYSPSVGLFANATIQSSIDDASIWLKNCYRLAENTNFLLKLLKKHLKASANAGKRLDVILPGSEIPEWFSHKTDGYSIKIPFPRNIWDDSKWIGVAFCCIFVNVYDEMFSKAFVYGRKSQEIWDHGIDFEREPVTKDHLWLQYISRNKLHSLSSEDHNWLNYMASNKLHSLSSEDKCGVETDELEVEIGLRDVDRVSGATSHTSPTKKVKKCGIRIVYEKDLEDMEQVEGRHLPKICHPTNATIEDNPRKYDEPETAATGEGALLKRKRSSYEDEEAAGASESDSIRERPQPIRLQQFLDYIMRKKR